MKCPICEATLRPGVTRCPDCGYHVSQNHATEPASAPRTSPVRDKKKTGCCCCALVLLPLLIALLIGMIALGEVIMTEVEIAIDEFDGRDAFDDVWPTEEMIPESIPETADESCFVLEDQTLYFLPENWDGSPVLNVPEFVGGEQVTAIGNGCFADCTELTTIILPDSILAIDPNAFDGCSKLRGLYLPEGLLSIGQDAFAGCIDMEAIYIPSSVQTIAEHAFDDCASLLYIFYGGSFEDWDALYNDYITPFTTAVCLDGYYYHGSGG